MRGGVWLVFDLCVNSTPNSVNDNKAMKAYRELSKDVGHQKLQGLTFSEVEHYQPGGREASLAGKMKTKPRHAVRKYAAASTTSSLLNGHTDYTGRRELVRMGDKRCENPLFLLFSLQEAERGCC